ncbi:hypothetical protein EYC80_006109 [Monilinia laxa]|uniref:Transmembrane protein n=1 Tax=Monilinia laxa TaxID=61186 RepID=A0A5N6KGD6_MONLA|nr:hypothetical protein EYC80_006109 [Monilinia laxa]
MVVDWKARFVTQKSLGNMLEDKTRPDDSQWRWAVLFLVLVVGGFALAVCDESERSFCIERKRKKNKRKRRGRGEEEERKMKRKMKRKRKI